jgi:hypothetical protein
LLQELEMDRLVVDQDAVEIEKNGADHDAILACPSSGL